MDYILKNGYFPFVNEIQDVYIKDGLVEKVEKDIEPIDLDTQIIDLENRIVISGFVDGHMHLDKALIGEKVINKSGTLYEAIEIMSKYKHSMTKEDVKERSKKILDLSFRNGTRFLRTHIDVDDKIQLKSIEALLELKEEYKESMDIQIVAFPQDGIIKNSRSYFYLEEALKMGADIVGGIPGIEEDPIKHMNMIFDLAMKYDVDIDMHIDETDDADSLIINDLARLTIANGYIGRVTAGHCCSLSANEKEIILPIVELVKKAKINIISLPSTNLYLQGRADKINIRRGIAPVKYLLDHDIPVAIGSDNIRDPFNPFGNGNLLEEILIAAHGCHMGGEKDLNKLFDMVSIIPGEALKFDYNIKEGNKANFIVIDAGTKVDSIIRQANIYGYFKNDIFGTNVINNQ
ncbi:amidohydrolase family protein [Tissierella carlieri]|jgi:cytosine deaminase|uniref:amidohydrolase family protein n=1 Tax=Tissierella carlieri TaxID=689904 RepID=UPI00280618B6|nr:amidohydrolase family protein [uncultured Tissierella sp.]MDU5082685.1 amidohydrolase family protein [Bacillota bacterium]